MEQILAGLDLVWLKLQASFSLEALLGGLWIPLIILGAAMLYAGSQFVRRTLTCFATRRAIGREAGKPGSYIQVIVTDYVTNDRLPNIGKMRAVSESRRRTIARLEEAAGACLPASDWRSHNYPKRISWKGYDPQIEAVSDTTKKQSDRLMQKTGASLVVSGRETASGAFDIAIVARGGHASRARHLRLERTPERLAVLTEDITKALGFLASNAIESEVREPIDAWDSKARVSYLRTLAPLAVDDLVSAFSESDRTKLEEGVHAAGVVALENDWIPDVSTLESLIELWERKFNSEPSNSKEKALAGLLVCRALSQRNQMDFSQSNGADAAIDASAERIMKLGAWQVETASLLATTDPAGAGQDFLFFFASTLGPESLNKGVFDLLQPLMEIGGEAVEALRAFKELQLLKDEPNHTDSQRRAVFAQTEAVVAVAAKQTGIFPGSAAELVANWAEQLLLLLKLEESTKVQRFVDRFLEQLSAIKSPDSLRSSYWVSVSSALLKEALYNFTPRNVVLALLDSIRENAEEASTSIEGASRPDLVAIVSGTLGFSKHRIAWINPIQRGYYRQARDHYRTAIDLTASETSRFPIRGNLVSCWLSEVSGQIDRQETAVASREKARLVALDNDLQDIEKMILDLLSAYRLPAGTAGNINMANFVNYLAEHHFLCIRLRTLCGDTVNEASDQANVGALFRTAAELHYLVGANRAGGICIKRSEARTKEAWMHSVGQGESYPSASRHPALGHIYQFLEDRGVDIEAKILNPVV